MHVASHLSPFCTAHGYRHHNTPCAIKSLLVKSHFGSRIPQTATVHARRRAPYSRRCLAVSSPVESVDEALEEASHNGSSAAVIDASTVEHAGQAVELSNRAAHTNGVVVNGTAHTAVQHQQQEQQHQQDIQPAEESKRLDADIKELLFPAMLTFSLDPLLGAVDTAIVGRLGTVALGAVGISNMAQNFTMMLFRFLTVVTTPAVAAAYAKQDKQKVSAAVTDGLWVAWACGIPVGLLIWTFAPQLLNALHAKGPLMAPATSYLRARAWAAPVATTLFVFQAVFRGTKDTKTPLKSSIISNAVNLSMDLFLVFVVGMGVTGAGLATTLSQYAAGIYLGSRLVQRGLLHLPDLKKLPDLQRLMPLIKAGVLLTAQGMISTVLLLQSAVFAAKMGPLAVAAHEVCRMVFILQYIIFAAVELTSQSLVASRLGADENSGASNVVGRMAQVGLACGLVTAAVVLCTSHWVPLAFTQDPQVIQLARTVLPVIALGAPIDGLAASLDGCLQGAADYRWVSSQMTIASAVSYGCILLSLKLNGGLIGLWLGLRVIGVVRVMAALYRLRSGRSRVKWHGQGKQQLQFAAAS